MIGREKVSHPRCMAIFPNVYPQFCLENFIQLIKYDNRFWLCSASVKTDQTWSAALDSYNRTYHTTLNREWSQAQSSSQEIPRRCNNLDLVEALACRAALILSRPWKNFIGILVVLAEKHLNRFEVCFRQTGMVQCETDWYRSLVSCSVLWNSTAAITLADFHVKRKILQLWSLLTYCYSLMKL